MDFKFVLSVNISMNQSGIYMITNPNGKIYIGMSTNIQARWNNYKQLSNFKKQKLLHRSIKKHGYESHKFEILEECVSDIKILSNKEIFWIKKKKSFYYENKKIGLNLTIGGNYPPKQTKPKSREHKDKISKANKGKKHTEETIEKIKQARSKQVFTKESIKKRSEKLIGRQSKLKGRKRPNISEKLKGKQTAISIKCSLTNTETLEIIQANSMQELSRKSGISISSLIKIRKQEHPKKYKHFKYEQ